jgi:hypothetical protein
MIDNSGLVIKAAFILTKARHGWQLGSIWINELVIA